MNPEFEELAERLSEELAERLSKDVAKQLGAVEQRLTARVDHAEDELKRHSTAHMESVKEEAKLAAEGYGATLGSIDRRLRRLEKKWDTKISDHDRVLDNHNDRISGLEHKRR